MKEQETLLRRNFVRLAEHNRLTGKETAEVVLSHMLFAVCGFLCARGAVMQKYLPFGIAAVAGCPSAIMPSVGVGVLVGSAFPILQSSGFRYVGALLAVVSIRLLVSRLKISRRPLFAGMIAFLSVFLTGVATFRDMPGGVGFSAVEAVLAGGGAYFVKRGSSSLLHNDVGLSGEQLTSVILTVGFVLLGLIPIAPGGISVGRILCVVLIHVAARYGNVGAGAILGITCALIQALGSADSRSAVMYCFGGLMAGVFASAGKIAQTAAFLAAAVIAGIPYAQTGNLTGLVIEFTVGSALYLLLPRTVCVQFGRVFAGRVSVVKPDGLVKGLTMRLRFASKALSEVSGTVDNVAGELSKIHAPDFRGVLQKIEHDACKGCSLQIYCWETRYDETLAAVVEMTKGVKQGHSNVEDCCPSEFKGRCLRVGRMSSAVYKYYSEYTSRFAAEQRVQEVRSVVADQFSGISQMLCSLADEFDVDERFDSSAAARIAEALKNIHVPVKECGVRLDKNDRMNVEIRVSTGGDTVLNRASVLHALQVSCERDFDPPCVTVTGEDTYISVSEHAYYTAEIGIHQIPSENAAVCGDVCDYFFDGKGRLIMLLSDGMGTGGRAAVDGAMAVGLMSRLLKAGFGYDAALKILNSSMLFKSTDESCATVDVVAVDLFTGRTELLKAGAAPTIVRRNGKAGTAQSTSLPAGILRNIGFDKAVISLRKGDIVLLLSDGAVSEGTDWIGAELESFDGGTAKELATRVCEGAKRRRTDRHEDDITVMAAILEKAV